MLSNNNDSGKRINFMKILTNLSRRKIPPTSSPRGFSRCLSTFELTSLGVGAILGAGIYVVTGQVAACIAGPSTFLSFIIAAIASILSGLAYAEFGARVPRTTGSAYAYSYVAVGEIWAFVIGWNLLLEYMIGTAADASALSASIENLASHAFGNTTLIFHPIPPIIGDHSPDILAFILTLLVTVLLAIGVRDSSRTTLICNIINGLIIVFIVVNGAFYADTTRWDSFEKVFPFGIGGTLSGAAACFYAFVGFDIIATTGEEAADASRSIPIAIVSSLVIVLVGYISVSIVLTMMVSYNTLDDRTPLASAFEQIGQKWAGGIISSGATFGLASSLIGSLFPLPRIVFAMANDGLLFHFFSKVNSKTEVPMNATIYPGILTAFFALFFDLKELVEMMSIGTLLAYTLVSFCILILRYQPKNEGETENNFQDIESVHEVFNLQNTKKNGISLEIDQTQRDVLPEERELEIPHPIPITPTKETYVIAVLCCCIIFLCFLFVATIFIFGFYFIEKKSWWMIFLLVLFGATSIISFIILNLQPQNQEIISFKAPFVPTLPLLAIICNIFLILKLSTLTWIRFMMWMFGGFLMYILYSYNNSKLSNLTT